MGVERDTKTGKLTHVYGDAGRRQDGVRIVDGERYVRLHDAVEVFKRLTRDPLNPPEPDDFEREFTK